MNDPKRLLSGQLLCIVAPHRHLAGGERGRGLAFGPPIDAGRPCPAPPTAHPARCSETGSEALQLRGDARVCGPPLEGSDGDHEALPGAVNVAGGLDSAQTLDDILVLTAQLGVGVEA